MDLALGGGLAIMVGVALIRFRKSFSRAVIEMQNAIWRTHMGEREVALNEVLAVIVGIGFLVAGLLNLLRKVS